MHRNSPVRPVIVVVAPVLLEDWRIDYNIKRPHSAIGWLSPVEFIEEWHTD
jgi:transposase InsO family protein